ncbi:MAG: SDR family oxidoreductase [Candidatus Micrarchaeota archaeon]
MKVLVTGGAGFIGSHIADALLAKGHEVRIIDDFSTGSEDNLRHSQGKIELIRGSITDRQLLEKAIEGVDYVFHEAAQVSVVDSIKNPARTWEINVTGTNRLLNAAVEYKVNKVVLASSAAVYGNEPGLPKTENMKTKPTSNYGTSKSMNEIRAERCHSVDRLKAVCLRYFNVYGPRQAPNSEYSGVISKFIKKMLCGERPTIYGDGKQTRDFIFVEDVVAANLLVMESKKINSGIYNIATGHEISLNDLVGTINEILDTKLEPIYEPERPDDIRRSVADISKAKKDLGFKPKYKFKEGLKKTIDWYKKN